MKCRYRWFVLNSAGQLMTQNTNWLKPADVAGSEQYDLLLRNASPLRVLEGLSRCCRSKAMSLDSLLTLKLIHLPTATELWPGNLLPSPFLTLGLMRSKSAALIAANFSAGKSFQIQT